MMGEIRRGKLVWQKTKKGPARRVIFRKFNKKTEKEEWTIPTRYLDGELSADLRDRAEDTTEEEIEVELELEPGKPPSRIRPVGLEWRSQAVVSEPAVAGGSRLDPDSQPAAPLTRDAAGEFHNPYNFVPAIPRKGVRGSLGDIGEEQRPPGHHRYEDGRFSGWIDVTATTASPLLLPDASRVEELPNKHKSFPVQIGPDDRPYLASTSVKGMLRSAYEAVTNSRLAVFQGHDRPLAYRMQTQEGLGLVPVRIDSIDQERDDSGEIIEETTEISILPGSSTVGPDGMKQTGPLYAAWLPLYPIRFDSKPYLTRGNSDEERFRQHGRLVWAYISKWGHTGHLNTEFWNVVELRPRELTGKFALRPTATPPDSIRPEWGRGHRLQDNQAHWVKGYLCITGRNINNKHDERVFFVEDHLASKYKATCRGPGLRESWETLIANYQDEHADEIRNGKTRPQALGNHCLFSRHIWREGPGRLDRKLREGTIAYARVTRHGQKWVVHELFPVNISRQLYRSTPDELLPSDLKPARSLQELSPADRAFGWVNQNGHGAYRGHLRVGPVQCLDDGAAESFDGQGVPLPILGAPKPQQARFYIAATKSRGEAQDRVTKKAAGYHEDKGLRGRKVYPHHRGVPDGYWTEPLEDRTQGEPKGGWFQEYRRPHEARTRQVQQGHRTVTEPVIREDGMFELDLQKEQRDRQNRSMRGWVELGTRFQFRLHVSNLDEVELGALLWLLDLPTEHYHRLGGGKPLGFGSVRLEVGGMGLRDGAALRERYSSLVAKKEEEREGRWIDWAAPGSTSESSRDGALPREARRIVGKYKDEVKERYATDGFDAVPFIAAFLQAAKGFEDGLPVHYPRVRRGQETDPVPPDPTGENFRWFTENEKKQGGHVVHGYSLPDLVDDQGLPYLKKE